MVREHARDPDAGIGKSLVQAFTEKLGATPHVVLRFQCSPYHTHSTLFPIVQHLGRAADFRPGDSNQQRLDKLEHMLADVRADIRTWLRLMRSFCPSIAMIGTARLT